MRQFVGYCHVMTTRAVLFQDHFWEMAEWLPLSQVQLEPDSEGMETTIKIEVWLCRKNDFEEFTERKAENAG